MMATARTGGRDHYQGQHNTTYPCVVAMHTASGWGRPWSGTPEDLVRLANEGLQIVRSAASEGHHCSVNVEFRRRRESSYKSPEEFLAGFTLSDIPKVKSVMFHYDSSGLDLSATAHLVLGPKMRPFVRVRGPEPSVVEGVANRLTGIFPGRRLGWQGLRRPGEISRPTRLRTHAGMLVMLVVTVAITAAVTIYVTRLLT